MRIDLLGAHLEAYVETLPTISALRLCNKFGSGPQCFINKLPVELIGMIEDFVVEPVRERARASWAKEYKCFQGNCRMIDDHLTREEQHDIYHRANSAFDEIQDCPGGRCSFYRNADDATEKRRRVKSTLRSFETVLEKRK